MLTLASIKYKNTINRSIEHYPVTYGVPLKEGVLTSGAGLGICLSGGKLLSLQTKVLERWPDGSVKWLLLDFEMPLRKNAEGECSLVKGARVPRAKTIKVVDTAGRLTVTTVNLSAAFNKKAFSLFESYKVNGTEMILPGSDIIIQSQAGRKYRASDSKKLDVKVIEQGHSRVVVEVSGRNTAGDGDELLSFRVRYTFRLNARGVMIAYKFTNREEPETGVMVGSINVVVPTALGDETTKLVRQANSGKRWSSRVHRLKENVELIAGGALNEAAKNRYGSASEGTVVIRDLACFRENLSEYEHYLRPGNARTDMTGGLRAAYPHLGVVSDRGSALGFFLGMDMNFPKGISCDRNALEFDVWPVWAEDLRVRRGQSKEHRMFVLLDDRKRSQKELEDVYFQYETGTAGAWGGASASVQFTIDKDYVRSTEVLEMHRWLRYDPAVNTQVEIKLGSIGDPGRPQRGMMDYGDHIADDRSWAHNNENDAILSGVREYYRAEKVHSLDAAIAKAYHNAHVDFIAFDPDPLREGTMPAHCPEHVDGATYPSHMWVDGLMAVYCVTGEPDFLDAAISVGENMLRWQKEGEVFYADSRECGWPMLAYLRLHEQTHDRKWLDAADVVFKHYRKSMDKDARIVHELPHGVGIRVGGYGEFITWRACFFYYERTGKKAVRDFLVKCLEKAYLRDPATGGVGGWASNDLFPAWAAYELTGDDKYIVDNYPFFKMLMKRQGNFPWGGVDMHYYLNELDRRGVLEEFCQHDPCR